ncbi:YiiX/YebB-like N1pC/P60 family cysteine hydrolase [Pararhodobacter zhoushanensis]|uniref:YiiX/YebB-like N1pC/P60 family cysteine hydrolase n=1 Tax=Pararhodobacter zhoushanensis TaxID=2479545 RepID=UPI000F8D9EEC|nr:YiiX/YebB-like N1pC/P60 family cysteine hydrolase [Pararhodobacter zhoushanensis]
MFERLGHFLGRFLERDQPSDQPVISQDAAALAASIRVGDVLLVEGRARISTAIKYLTQSTWSHAALCVRDLTSGEGRVELVEVTLQEGCHRVPLSKYTLYNTRLCRAAGLSVEERQTVADFLSARIGITYDTRNVIDLARYLFPTPPVPVRWRRPLLSLGSGDPTRAICSSLIAQAFQSVEYPVLPKIEMLRSPTGRPLGAVWHHRHASLIVPRDFDLSPYFAVVKPTLHRGFDHHRIPWAENDADGAHERVSQGKIVG